MLLHQDTIVIKSIDTEEMSYLNTHLQVFPEKNSFCHGQL